MNSTSRPSLVQQSLFPDSPALDALNDSLRSETKTDASEALFNEARLKVLVIDAICGVGFPTPMLGTACEQAGMARFDMETGVYEWRRNALAASPLEKLQQLYDALCEARDDEFVSVGAPHDR